MKTEGGSDIPNTGEPGYETKLEDEVEKPVEGIEARLLVPVLGLSCRCGRDTKRDGRHDGDEMSVYDSETHCKFDAMGNARGNTWSIGGQEVACRNGAQREGLP